MPRFHFPIVDGTKLDDPVGIELKDTDEAKKLAKTIATQLQGLDASKPRNVVAVDENGDEVYKAPVADDKSA